VETKEAPGRCECFLPKRSSVARQQRGNWLPRKMLSLRGLGGGGAECKGFHSCPQPAGKRKERFGVSRSSLPLPSHLIQNSACRKTVNNLSFIDNY
jgi:hypothetical protein